MAIRGRIGTIGLTLGGLLLVAGMIYTLAIGGVGGPGGAGRASWEVAVLLPDREGWDDIHRGLFACQRRGLIEEVVAEPNRSTITFRTPEHHRLVRLSWHGGGGVVAARGRVEQLMGGPSPPSAFVGSNNTVLTAAVAGALREFAPPSGGGGPILLVPWATSVEVERSGDAAIRLLDLYSDRSFRFCPNNWQEAELVTRCAAERDGRPSRALMLVDEGDPYSRDLAVGFERAVAALAPGVAIERTGRDLTTPGPPTFDDRPGSGERRDADRLWDAIEDSAGDGPVWVILPVQGGPARRLIRALTTRAASVEPGVVARLQVLCGDGIGRESLAELLNDRAFPVWSASSGSIPRPADDALDVPDGAAQVTAEIVAALARVFDVPAGHRVDPAEALRSLEVPADAAMAFGRSLAFDPATGERRGADLGHVLAIRPDRDGVLAFGHGDDAEARRRVPDRLPMPAFARLDVARPALIIDPDGRVRRLGASGAR